MKRLWTIFIVLPLCALAIALAVANRKPVTVSLDPFSPDTPAYAVTVPLFTILFAGLIIGLIIGSMFTWLRQARYRREAKRARRERKAAEELAARQTTEAGTALSLFSPRN